MKMTVDYQALATSAPINRDAAIARDGVSRQGYEPAKKIVQRHWSAPPPLQPMPEGVVNRAGIKFGKFTVVGYLERNKKKGSLWLVRCTCGDYESRRGKAIDNPENAWDCCEKCRHVMTLRRSDHFRRTGKNKPIDEFA